MPTLRVIDGGATGSVPVVSVVVPAHDEQPSLWVLANRVRDVLDRAGLSFELIVVDDGSRDGTAELLRSLAREDPRFRARILRHRHGKSAALGCGLAAARGRIVATMDADLQDLPEELPAMLEPIRSGRADVVQAWRRDRHDVRHKVLASRLFNQMCSAASGFVLHDVNCGFKAMTAEAAATLELGDDTHRFVPVMLHRLGYRVVEVQVHHARRAFGRSKYGPMRYARGLRLLVKVVLRDRPPPPRALDLAELIDPPSATVRASAPAARGPGA